MSTEPRRPVGTLAISLRMLRDGIRGQTDGVALGLLVLAGSSIVVVLQPWPVKLIIDSVLGAHPLPPLVARLVGGASISQARLLVALCVTLMILQAMAGLLNVLSTHLLVSAGLRMVFRLRCALFDHVQRMSLPFHDASTVGDSLHRVVWSTYCVQTMFNSALVPATTAAVTLAGITVALYHVDKAVTVTALFVCVPLVILIRRVDRPMTEHSLRAQERESDVSTRVQETLSGIRAVQAFSREDYESDRFRSGADASMRANLRLTVLQTVAQALVQFVLAAGTVAVVYVSATGVLRGRLTTGDVVLIISYVALLYKPLETLAYTAAVLQGAAAGARRVYAVLDSVPAISDYPDAVELAGRASGAIQFRDVEFAYTEGRRALCGVSLEIPAGTSVALVGASGAGKTTLASLLLRLYDPDSGSVLLDGELLGSFTLKSLRRNIALVPQEPILFNATVYENIAYARPDATPEEVRQAAGAAGAHDFIVAMPQGYETQIGESGVALSGGQRQRLSIARAFLKDAPVLVMDEPTSALDAETEARLVANIEELTRGRTCLIIAHRLSTVRHVDRVVVMDAGRIVEEGAPQDLLRARGYYWKLAQRADAVRSIVAAGHRDAAAEPAWSPS